MMKIYFAGSIRGGRDDKEIYVGIIELLKKFGTVLTEHIGDITLSEKGQSHITDFEIYEKDTSWIREADVLVAEVTRPSLGVGYEIGYAESIKKRIIILYRPQEERRLSAMISGNKKLHLIFYQKPSELKEKFDSAFG